MRWTFAAGSGSFLSGSFLLGSLLSGLFLLACGSEVLVYDEEEQAFVAVDDDGSGHGGPGSSCVRCGEGDCGMCAMMYGASHRCADDIPPASGCYELGSLFEEDGEYYVCWSCE